VLVGRSRSKLEVVENEIRATGSRAVSVVGDFSDIVSARHAAVEVAGLGLPIKGVLNNAGIMSSQPFTSAQGWDGVFATDHLGPFAFTEELVPSLADGTHVALIVSAVEDPERKPAVASGFRGSRYISAEASARGEWAPGGSKNEGFDAYATAKQGNLATVLAFAREIPRLRFAAIEPGFNPGSDLSRDAAAPLRFLAKYVMSPLAPIQDTEYQDRYVAETRALLAAANTP
jgi:NAD(P)-dependent dehydrogenase (short-subunit alcohol dehydrogenase family)